MSTTIRWGNEAIALTIDARDDSPVTLTSIAPASAEAETASVRLQPLVEAIIIGDGHALTNTRSSYSGVGSRLRYVDHTSATVDGAAELRIRQADAATGIVATSVLRAHPGVAAVQSWTELSNTGDTTHIVQLVSSLALGAVLEQGEDAADVSLLRARSEWCAESRWSSTPIRGRDGLPDINNAAHGHLARGTLTTVSKSTWSSGEYLPTGVLVNEASGRALAWQIEHNGAWRWEVNNGGEHENALALILSGPNDGDHQWSIELAPGASFASVPVSVSVSGNGMEGAIAGLTAQRRATRRHNAADAHLPVIYNDYMNALMGDPTTEKLLPLIDAAATAGAEYFCIDAGWYDDNGDWWPSVGAWTPSTSRFPDGGLVRVLDHIRSTGMKPGLWVEPEVVGVNSPIAETLPDAAFVQRYGRRVVEHDRYLLDFRHPAAVAHLDAVFDTLIGEYGARYFKLDYNVTPGAGTDVDALSAGQGLLEINRAHLAWLDSLTSRYPEVIFEACSSGAQRMDYAILNRLDLQSTSDQQDHRLYASIAAAAPMSLLPEQAGNWAYPQAGMSPEDIAFTMVNGLSGRLYLSGMLDAMSAAELALVTEGVEAFQAIRGDINTATAFWPLGLPAWEDQEIALGLRAADGDYLVVWSRGDGGSIELPLAATGELSVETVYPRALAPWATSWNADAQALTVTPAQAGPTARIFRVAPTAS